MNEHDPKRGAPPPIAWPDEKTAPVAVPFELLEQCVRSEEPAASPFDGVPSNDASPAISPSRSFGGQATGKYGLDDLLSATGDVLLLGDPFDVASTTVVSTTVPSDDDSEPPVTTTTSILVGRDIERMLSPATVLGPNPARPTVELSAFEQFVCSQLDGKKTIDAVGAATGLSVGDLRIALALLADKDQLVVVTTSASPWDVPAAAASSSAPAPIVSRTFAPVTVLRRIDGAVAEGLSALEGFVLSQVDGRRSVRELRERAKLSASDLALALELLQRRGLVERASTLPKPTPPTTPPTGTPPTTPPTGTPTVAPPASTPTMTPPPTTKPKPTPLEALLTEAERKEARGDLPGAIALLQQAVRLDTRNAAVWNRLGTSLVRLYDLPAALAALNTALSLSPNDPTIVSNQKRVALLAGQVVRSTGKR